MEHKISNELPQVPNPERQESMLQQSDVLQGVEVGSETLKNKAFEAGQGSAPLPVSPQLSSQPTAPVQQTQVTHGIAAAAMPIIADDADLIEKEWVLKAKEIVARTRHDPHEQNKEVERMKADYMKKRYNKDVKITED